MGLRFVFVTFASMLAGCAVLHHAQIGDIDSRGDRVQIPFDIKLSEVGIDLNEAAALARATKTQAGKDVGDAAAILALFQMGPRTGAPVYDEHYAEKILYYIYEKCPSGQVTGLNLIRETRSYPVVKGEIVKVTGFCLKNRKPAQAEGA